MPTTSIDTFFACTILIAAALMSTAFLTSTMQTTINNTQDLNKQSYLKAMADRIITSTGDPVNWGSSSGVPSDFGLAAGDSAVQYDLDVDKVTRLNGLNNGSLSYFDLAVSSKLSNIAVGISVNQIMSVTIQQSSNSTGSGSDSFVFSISTAINSEPTSASLHCYIIAKNFISNLTGATSDGGVECVSFQISDGSVNNALLVVFARASFDDRVTSYAIYNFQNATQESSPSNDVLALNPLNYAVSFTSNSSDLALQNGYVFSYSYMQSFVPEVSVKCPIPSIIDKSPFVIVVCGQNGGVYFEEWVSYPQVPLKAGSSFEGSEQNVFSYTVTIQGCLYQLEVSFGAVPS